MVILQISMLIALRFWIYQIIDAIWPKWLRNEALHGEIATFKLQIKHCMWEKTLHIMLSNLCIGPFHNKLDKNGEQNL